VCEFGDGLCLEDFQKGSAKLSPDSTPLQGALPMR
jgi:hypothetical protein